LNEPVLDLTALRNVLASLAGSIEVISDSAWFDRQPPNVQNTLLAGAIQNFEFVFEISVKMIKRQIELESISPTEIDGASFRDILRIAAKRVLIADVEAWFRYRKMRNLTAHTYDRAKAQEVYRDTLTFLDDARSLLARLEARNG
jgi:nucleotidyltransferase substrate binding protein (TIGR01987 family)